VHLAASRDDSEGKEIGVPVNRELQHVRVSVISRDLIAQ